MNTFLDDNLNAIVMILAMLLVIAIIVSAWLYMLMRRVRQDQKVVLGDDKARDLVAHARATQERVDQLVAYIDGLEEQIQFTGKRLDDCLTFRSVTRYDAYRDLSGMQSTSVALIDTRFSGMVISSITRAST
jgi:hypothetical protein